MIAICASQGQTHFSWAPRPLPGFSWHPSANSARSTSRRRIAFTKEPRSSVTRRQCQGDLDPAVRIGGTSTPALDSAADLAITPNSQPAAGRLTGGPTRRSPSSSERVLKELLEVSAKELRLSLPKATLTCADPVELVGRYSNPTTDQPAEMRLRNIHCGCDRRRRRCLDLAMERVDAFALTVVGTKPKRRPQALP